MRAGCSGGRTRLPDIGEAVKALPTELLDAERVRDHLAHRYFDQSRGAFTPQRGHRPAAVPTESCGPAISNGVRGAGDENRTRVISLED